MSSCTDTLDDIEDIIKAGDLGPNDRAPHKHVLPKIRSKRLKKVNGFVEDLKPHGDSIIPGTQSVFVRTWGCSHNNSDSEYMAGQLAAYGYKITEKSEEADLWLLNSCTVKNPSEDGFRNAIKKAKELNKHLVVAGCVPQGSPKHDMVKGVSIVGVQQIDRVVEVVEETLKGHTVRLLGQKKKDGKKYGGAALDLPKIRKNPLIEIIAINTGCLNQCTYCKTKHARGDLGSYTPEEIVNRIKQAFEEGVVEVWMTSEDTGAYGHDIGVTLPQLLWQVVEVIPEGGLLRLGMTNPPYILEHLEEMAKVLNHPRVYSFLHVPVQSGSDAVLSDMRREYCVDDFRHVVDFLKKRVPGITIATDVICGFPTETDEDFQMTVELVKEYKFPSLFINQFYPRPGTPAAKMPRVKTTSEVKEWTREISKVFKSYTPYDHKVGERQTILVTEDSHDKKHFVGHNKFYEQVLLPKSEAPDVLGKLVEVDIISTGKHYLMGRLAADCNAKSPGLVEPKPKGVVTGVKVSTSPALNPKQWWMTAFVVALLMVVIADVCSVFSRWIQR